MTGLTGEVEQDAVLARLTPLCGGRVYDSVPEEAQQTHDGTTMIVQPYIIVTFGQMFPSAFDRTIDGADSQPQIMPIVVECWAGVAKSARRTAGQVRKLLIGWHPDSANASEIELRGGGWFQQRAADVRPALFMESVSAETTLNLAADA